MILGVGCTLYSDEGFGVRVIEKIQEYYQFPENVLVVDGGVLGINLLGVGCDFQTESAYCGGCHPQ
jgi:hydrogenase maturation protease